MTAASAIVDRVMKRFRRYDNPDILTANISDSETSIPFQGLLPGWGPGSYVEIGSETMLVSEVDSANKLATVSRGQLYTTAVAHTANSPIYLDPRVLRSDVLDLFNDCLEDLVGRDLFAVDGTTITYDPDIIGYELPSDALTIIRVDGLKDDAAKYWEPMFDWLEVDTANTNDFSTSKALMMRVALPPGEFRVVYGKAFTSISLDSDDLQSDVGLKSYMNDLLFYFAMGRVMPDLETRRSQIESASSHQRAQDAPAFLALRTGQWYQSRYDERVNSARARLHREVQHSKGTGFGS